MSYYIIYTCNVKPYCSVTIKNKHIQIYKKKKSFSWLVNILMVWLLPYMIGKAYVISCMLFNTNAPTHTPDSLHICLLSLCPVTEVLVKRRSSSGTGKTIIMSVFHFQSYFCTFFAPWHKIYLFIFLSLFHNLTVESQTFVTFFWISVKIFSFLPYFLRAIWSVASHTCFAFLNTLITPCLLKPFCLELRVKV